MRSYVTFILLLVFINPGMLAQVSDLTVPISWGLSISNKTTQMFFPSPDKDTLLRQDELEGEGTYRFGVEQTAEITLSNFDMIELNAGRLYRLSIASAGSLSLNINFSRFIIQPGTKMWIYDPSKSYKLGAFTWRNVNAHHNFATIPLPTDQLIIELFEPWENQGTSDVEISGIVTGYRPIIAEKAGFGQSGACNININCGQASAWENERQAVVMLLTANNTRKCTGTLVNNTAQDGTPYVLTARHCNTATNAIFMFNYQSPGCSNIDGITNHVLQGCEIVAENAFSDFTLVKMDQNPLPDFNPFYAGWNRNNTAPPMSFCIHHPSGDIKKFSTDSNAVVSSGYVSQPDSLNNHWKVLDWDLGTTEPGSSGSPLFNTQHQIIGQLHGGFAACNNNLSDYYGRFDVSWLYGSSPNARLKEWLDPVNSDSIALPGIAFSSPFYNRDIKLSQIIQPEPIICDSILKPRLSIVSWGSDTVTSITINYSVDQEEHQYLWTGTLQFMQNAMIELPEINISVASNYLFTAKIGEVNMLPDENTGNDSLSKLFEKIAGNSYVLEFTTDSYPHENRIAIIGEDGNQVFSAISFQPNQINEYELCFRQACYTVTLTDSYGDGICCEYGQGMFLFREKGGQYVAKFHHFTDTISFRFCSPIHYFTNELFIIYPNPAAGFCNLLLNPEIQDNVLELSAIDLNGKLIYQENFSNEYYHTLNLFGLPGGVYVLMLRDVTTGKIWKEKLIVLNY